MPQYVLFLSQMQSLSGPMSSAFLQMAASRIEFHLNKLQAVERWESVPAPPGPKQSMKSKVKTMKNTSRHILDTHGCGQETGRRLLQSPCKLAYNKNFVGSTLNDGFKKSITRWKDCCKACVDRAECVAWTMNADKYKTNLNGCWLKGPGYTTKSPALGYISGTVSANRE